MPNSVEETLEALKKKMRAASDAELARKLRVDKSTISSWKARGKVPDRYIGILNGDSHQFILTTPPKWSTIEAKAFGLALYLHSVIAETIADADYRPTLALFSQQGFFWMLMNNCLHELVNHMEETGQDAHTAFAVVLHEYVEGTRSVNPAFKLYEQTDFLSNNEL